MPLVSARLSGEQQEMCCLGQALMDKSFFLSLFPVPLESPKSTSVPERQLCPALSDGSEPHGVNVAFAGPCNPTVISQTELGSHRQDRAAGIGDLSGWQGWDGGVWSILATGTARGVPSLQVPRLSWEGIPWETVQGLCLDVHPWGF